MLKKLEKKGLIVILDRYLTSKGVRLKIGGVVTRDVAHFQGVPHGTVQVAVVVLKKIQGQKIPHILLHLRSQWKETSPETWDICGGHIDFDPEIVTNPKKWEAESFIEELFNSTALREANEEVRIQTRDSSEFVFTEKHIKCFGGLGVFECGFDNPVAKNREHSALYIAFVPSDVVVVGESEKPENIFTVEDTVGVGAKVQNQVALGLKLIPLPELVLDFIKHPNDYADGIGRVLSRVKDEPGTMKSLVRFLESHY